MRVWHPRNCCEGHSFWLLWMMTKWMQLWQTQRDHKIHLEIPEISDWVRPTPWVSAPRLQNNVNCQVIGLQDTLWSVEVNWSQKSMHIEHFLQGIMVSGGLFTQRGHLKYADSTNAASGTQNSGSHAHQRQNRAQFNRFLAMQFLLPAVLLRAIFWSISPL